MPGDDLVTPADDGAAQGADLGRAELVLEILAKLVDELAGQEQLVAASIRPHVSLAPIAVELRATPDDVIQHLQHRFLEGDDVIAGDRRRIVRRFGGEAGQFRYATVEIVCFEPNAVPFEHLRGPFADCHERFDLVRTTTGSRLTHTGAFSLRGGLWTWPFALFAVRPAFQRLVGEHLQQQRGEIAAPG